MTDEITRLSMELARNPAGQAFLRLGELLRKRGELAAAMAVAMRGGDRHPESAEAHDLIARIAIDRGDAEGAGAAWQAALRLNPRDGRAHKGLGFIAFRAGRLSEAIAHLALASEASPDDVGISGALEAVTGAIGAAAAREQIADSGGAPRAVAPGGDSPFSDVSVDGTTALLLDDCGMVLAAGGRSDDPDKAAEIGAYMSGVSDEADRAMRHLELGSWRMILIEAPEMSAGIAPAAGGAVVMVMAPRSTPLGFLRLTLERLTVRARNWMGGGS